MKNKKLFIIAVTAGVLAAFALCGCGEYKEAQDEFAGNMTGLLSEANDLRSEIDEHASEYQEAASQAASGLNEAIDGIKGELSSITGQIPETESTE